MLAISAIHRKQTELVTEDLGLGFLVCPIIAVIVHFKRNKVVHYEQRWQRQEHEKMGMNTCLACGYSW